MHAYAFPFVFFLLFVIAGAHRPVAIITVIPLSDHPWVQSLFANYASVGVPDRVAPADFIARTLASMKEKTRAELDYSDKVAPPK